MICHTVTECWPLAEVPGSLQYLPLDLQQNTWNQNLQSKQWEEIESIPEALCGANVAGILQVKSDLCQILGALQGLHHTPVLQHLCAVVELLAVGVAPAQLPSGYCLSTLEEPV